MSLLEIMMQCLATLFLGRYVGLAYEGLHFDSLEVEPPTKEVSIWHASAHMNII